MIVILVLYNSSMVYANVDRNWYIQRYDRRINSTILGIIASKGSSALCQHNGLFGNSERRGGPCALTSRLILYRPRQLTGFEASVRFSNPAMIDDDYLCMYRVGS